MTSRYVRWGCRTVLAILFLASLNSLTTFPTTFDDEGYYALSARNYVERGQFGFWSGKRPAPFEKGDALRSRINPLAFVVLGKVFGSGLRTARIVPFAWVWISIVLFFFISSALGVPGELGALLFAATEKIFYASHVFRPEASLILFTTVFLFMVVRLGSTHPVLAAVRGLLNGGFVLSHGDGIVAALINTWDVLKKKAWFLSGLYALGALAGIGAFYLVQIHGTGGWRSFFGQLQAQTQYQPRGGLMTVLRRECEWRWGLELVKVGASRYAKVFRWFFYLAILSTAIYSSVRLKGMTRTLAVYALLCVLGFVFLVHDKNDIQISEMEPFLIASFLAWAGAKTVAAKYRRLGFFSVLGVCLALTFHHALAYRGPTSFDREVQAIDPWVTRYPTVVGEAQYWFHFQRLPGVRFVYWRELDYYPPLKGGILFIGSPPSLPNALKCKVDFRDPDSIFTAVYCNE